MSKSTGRLVDLGNALERFGGSSLRLFYLQAHYRSPLDFSEELVESAAAGYDRLRRFLVRAELAPGTKPAAYVMDRFIAAMDLDFATPDALAIVFETVAEANRQLDEGENPAELTAAIHEIVDVLGLGPQQDDLGDLIPELEALAAELSVEQGEPEAIIEGLLNARAAAKAGRDFATSDLIRGRLAAIGIMVEDTSDGARWLRR